MSKKKAKKNSEQGVYALCMTAGFIVGLGLGPIIGSILVTMTLGLALGAICAYFINRQSKTRKH